MHSMYMNKIKNTENILSSFKNYIPLSGIGSISHGLSFSISVLSHLLRPKKFGYSFTKTTSG